MKNIYLAGKCNFTIELDEDGEVMNEYNWRQTIVNHELNFSEYPDLVWPILENAIFEKYNYTGPFIAKDSHGNLIGGDHGLENEIHYGFHNPGQFILIQCQSAIYNSDVIFAWIDDKTCYGTIFEIGHANALNKQIWIAGPEKFDDLWFIYESAGDEKFGKDLTPETALREFLFTYDITNYIFESPIESSFWNYLRKAVNNVIPQFQIDKYRVDFAIPEKSIAIELDGHDYHKTKEQRTYDAQRERYLEMNGWHVIRFTGSEIYNNTERCINETLTLIERWGNKK